MVETLPDHHAGGFEVACDGRRLPGVTVLNDDMTGRVHQDRRLLTGDSPLAANNLGLLAADVLVSALQGDA